MCVLVVVEKSWCVYVCNGLGQVCGWGREAGKSIVVPVLFWPEGRKPWKWGVERRRKKGHSDTVSVIGFEISFLFQSVLVFLKCRVCVINSRVIFTIILLSEEETFSVILSVSGMLVLSEAARNDSLAHIWDFSRFAE